MTLIPDSASEAALESSGDTTYLPQGQSSRTVDMLAVERGPIMTSDSASSEELAGLLLVRMSNTCRSVLIPWSARSLTASSTPL